MNNLDSSKIKNIKALQSILEDPLKLRAIAKEIFKLIDIDCNEFIELNELYNFMCDVANSMEVQRPSLEEIKDIVGILDNDYDNKISIEEFEIFLREILEKMIEKEQNEQVSIKKPNV